MMLQFMPNSKDTRKNKILKIIRIVCLLPFVLSVLLLLICPFMYRPAPQGQLDFGQFWSGSVFLFILIFDGGGYMPLWPIFIIAIVGIIVSSVKIDKGI